MINYTFLKKDFMFKLFLISIIFMLILPFLYFFSWLFLLAILLLLFRKNKVTYKNSLSNNVEIILSPVTGKVTQIFHDNNADQFIKIQMHALGPYGLYLPYSSEIQMRQYFKGSKVWRGSKKLKPESNVERFLVEFKNKLGHITSVEVFSCILSGKPDVWIVTGDKGRSSACFGYIPLGGTVLIKVPKESNLLINVNEKVKAGFTILAGIKG